MRKVRHTEVNLPEMQSGKGESKPKWTVHYSDSKTTVISRWNPGLNVLSFIELESGYKYTRTNNDRITSMS